MKGNKIFYKSRYFYSFREKKKLIIAAVVAVVVIAVIIALSVGLQKSDDEKPATTAAPTATPKKDPLKADLYKKAAVAADAKICSTIGKDMLSKGGHLLFYSA